MNEEIIWSKYREILDIRVQEIRKICEKKMLSVEIKTDHDVRVFKRRYRKTDIPSREIVKRSDCSR